MEGGIVDSLPTWTLHLPPRRACPGPEAIEPVGAVGVSFGIQGLPLLPSGRPRAQRGVGLP